MGRLHAATPVSILHVTRSGKIKPVARVRKRFRITAWPTAVLIDPAGRIISNGFDGPMLRSAALAPTLERVLPK
jgi:hypothetical protein